MNVLAEFHNDGLWLSFHLLFEKRWGWKLYRPYGMDWYNQRYYKMYAHTLMTDPYGWLAKLYLEDTIYNVKDGMGIGMEARHGCDYYPPFRLLTLPEAKDTQLDYIICTIRDNEPYFRKFRDEFHPKAKLVRQVGNSGDIVDCKIYRNLMSSDLACWRATPVPNKILYHQEFDLHLFNYVPPTHTDNIYCFINAMNEVGNKEYGVYDLWRQHEHQFPEFNFRAYGVFSDFGRIFSKRELVRKMHDASFFWHVKHIDGYGHIAVNAFAVGRPVITRRECYADKLAGPLFEDGKTCLFIDDNFPAKLRAAAQWDRLQEMSRCAYQRFSDVVDFDREANELQGFFGRCS